jgi:hypothetical protein
MLRQACLLLLVFSLQHLFSQEISLVPGTNISAEKSAVIETMLKSVFSEYSEVIDISGEVSLDAGEYILTIVVSLSQDSYLTNKEVSISMQALELSESWAADLEADLREQLPFFIPQDSMIHLRLQDAWYLIYSEDANKGQLVQSQNTILELIDKRGDFWLGRRVTGATRSAGEPVERLTHGLVSLSILNGFTFNDYILQVDAFWSSHLELI